MFSCCFFSFCLLVKVINLLFMNYSKFAPKPARPPYQLAPLPTRPNHLFHQLAPLMLPARPHVACQLALSFTNSPHFSHQLAPLLLPARPTFLPTRPTSLTNSPRFSYQLAPRSCQLAPLLDRVGWAHDCTYHTNQSK